MFPNENRIVMVNSFRQVKCIVKDPNLGNLKKIAFSNANFFINCPEYRITRYENPAIDSFQGLKLNADNDARTIFKGSKSDLWHFGFYKPDDSGKEKVYESKPGGVPS